MKALDESFMARIVQMVLSKRTEDALLLLSRHYEIKAPEIVVGTIKGKRRTVYAVYVHMESRIYCLNSDVFFNPFIIIHEFYHHLRMIAGIHRGSERHANQYARDFILSYNKYIDKITHSNLQKQ